MITNLDELFPDSSIMYCNVYYIDQWWKRNLTMITGFTEELIWNVTKRFCTLLSWWKVCIEDIELYDPKDKCVANNGPFRIVYCLSQINDHETANTFFDFYVQKVRESYNKKSIKIDDQELFEVITKNWGILSEHYDYGNTWYDRVLWFWESYKEKSSKD